MTPSEGRLVSMTDTPHGGGGVPDLGALFAALPTAFVVMDRRLVIVEVNDAYTEMVGLDRADLLGRQVFSAFPPPPDLVAETGVNPVEVSFLRALDGATDAMPLLRYDLVDPTTGLLHERFWSLLSQPVRGPDGGVEFVLHRVEDLTDHVLERHRSDAVERTAARTIAAQARTALLLTEATDDGELARLLRSFGSTVIGTTHFASALGGKQGRAAAVAQVRSAGALDSAAFPVLADGQVLGEVAFGWSGPRALTAVEHDQVEAVVAQYGQALVRVRTHEAERRATAAAAGMSTALQRGMLSDPRPAPGLEFVARYRPAAEWVQVGGDWYDGFASAAGTTTFVVGDVSGHDGEAAAAMGQVRSLLRGIAYTVDEGPAEILTRLDHALADLAVEALTTVVVATVSEDPGTGVRTVRWSNAGHPPPLFVPAQGPAELLTTPPELLLGYEPTTERTNHERELPPGAALLLYTDGLVERRDASIDDGSAWLLETVRGLAGTPVEELCDELLALVEGFAEDDVVLLAAQALPAGTRVIDLSARERSPEPGDRRGTRR